MRHYHERLERTLILKKIHILGIGLMKNNLTTITIMKNILYGALTLLAFTVISCTNEKELPDNNLKEQEGLSFRAYLVDGDITKTNYENEVSFSWVGNECVSMQLVNKTTQSGISAGNKIDRWVFYNETSSGGSEAKFVSCPNSSNGQLNTTNWGLATYAFYPASADHQYAPENVQSFYAGYLMARQTNNNDRQQVRVSYDANGTYQSYCSTIEHPLQLVPMIGVNDGNGGFAFHTAMGILRVNISNIDSRLGKVRLYSEGQQLNGYFTLNGTGNDAYIAMKASETSSEFYIDSYYSDWTESAGSSLPFYFPVPVGTLNGGFKIQLIDKNDNVLRTVVSPSGESGNVAITRNKISEITASISVPSTDYSASITIGGTPSAITARLSAKGNDAATVQIGIAATPAEALSVASSNTPSESFTSTAEGAKTISTNLSTSGRYYVALKTFDSAGNSQFTGSTTTVYFLSATDRNNLCGSTGTKELTISSMTRNNANATGTGKIIFAEHSNPTEGQIQLLSLDGMSTDKSRSRVDMTANNAFFLCQATQSWIVSTNYPFSTNKILDGEAMIGRIENGSLVFANSGFDTPLFKYSVEGTANGHNYDRFVKVVVYTSTTSAHNQVGSLTFNIGESTISTPSGHYVITRWDGYYNKNNNGNVNDFASASASANYTNNSGITASY